MEEGVMTFLVGTLPHTHECQDRGLFLLAPSVLTDDLQHNDLVLLETNVRSIKPVELSMLPLSLSPSLSLSFFFFF